MNFQPLIKFLKKQANDAAPQQTDLVRLMQGSNKDVALDNPEITATNLGSKKPKYEIEDAFLDAPNVFPDLIKEEKVRKSQHKQGPIDYRALFKKASSFIGDVKVKNLPTDVQKEIARFIDVKPNTTVIRYGMVASELANKVDSHNMLQADEHTKNYIATKEEALTKLKNKYILLINDKVVDGHHAIAKAKKHKITNALNVLDLTPARINKTATILEVLRRKLKHA